MPVSIVSSCSIHTSTGAHNCDRKYVLACRCAAARGHAGNPQSSDESAAADGGRGGEDSWHREEHEL